MIKRILGPFFEDKTRVRRNKDTRMELNEDYSRSFQDLLFHLLWSFFLPIRSNRIIQLKNTSQHDSLFVFTNPKKNDKNVKIQRKREGRLLFPSDQRFAYLHYPFPGTISITTSHSDSRALTQTRIATRGVPLENVSTLEQRNVYRCAFSFSPGLFTSGILFFSFSFFFLLHLSSFLAWWSSINALVRETVAGSKAYPPLSNTPNHPSDM